MAREPGWYGKIPSLGDFASRRLRHEFVAAWDSWLQRSMAASRATLGDGWLDCYLTSPIWRFALMPGVFDSSAWAGLLMASVDRVGRHFPLTLAYELEPADCPDPLCATLRAQTWYAELEKVALSALDIDCSAADLESELARHPYPAPYAGDDEHVIEDVAQWWHDTAGNAALCVNLPSTAAMRDMLTAATTRILAGTANGKSLWWTETQGSGATQLHCLVGLPPEDYFRTLLQGP